MKIIVWVRIFGWNNYNFITHFIIYLNFIFIIYFCFHKTSSWEIFGLMLWYNVCWSRWWDSWTARKFALLKNRIQESCRRHNLKKLITINCPSRINNVSSWPSPDVRDSMICDKGITLTKPVLNNSRRDG